ncbi:MULTISPECIES: DUF1735 and LamG domain-containing protein [Alistipes]|jgi:hypothetical protein|uniref:DUF1735 and LamG domain-containing protein n=1 Tax=Alistipes TaxID=239759 RepID=UPI000EBEE279|nr:MULTISPECIES: DUF1735 and LamG domain-containing protein [Alistipes]HCF08969.1 hypothetical protein [Alistipes sp.]
MKNTRLYLFSILSFAVAFISCKDDEYDNKSPFDNVVYLDVAENSDTQITTFKKTLTELKKEFSVVLSYPASQDVRVNVEVEPSLIDVYNARHNTSWRMLDSRYYTLSADKITIPAGKTISDQLNLELKDLDGSTGGEELPIDETYLVPITISHVEGGVSTLRSSATAYYLVKRSSAITSAASLRDNWINFPTLDKASEGSMLFNNLTAVTYEAIIRVDDFSKHSEISTIMGVENYLLLRIGDASFPRQQLQFDGSGDSAQTPGFGKFPKKDEAKLLNAGEWYHIAATYSYATREVCLYVNGKLQSKGSDLGNAASTPFNLAGRAFYDLYLQDPETYKDYKDWGNFRQFFLGKSYDDSRQLNGDITEVRVWNVARNEQEIWDNMYDVDPQTPGLIGYWKFDEGAGNVIKDWTGNGNDAVAEKDLEWPEGIEVPQLNKE